MNFFEGLKEYEGLKPGLSRVKKFLNSVGNPQNKFKSIHVAGTNGKGSVCAIIAASLKAAGFKTGLFTSPHLVNITERININGTGISRGDFAGLEKKYLGSARKYKLTFFEYIAALAFIHFANEKVDIAVIETGLGGRFDATNVISPVLSIITSVSLDHQEFLGGTIKKIAFEKAGIIKANVPVFIGSVSTAALEVIKKTAAKQKAPLSAYGTDFFCSLKNINWKNLTQTVTYEPYGAARKRVVDYKMKLLGAHQAVNAGVAVSALKSLNVSDGAIKKGLLSARWSARFEVLRNGKKTFVIDGAHNAESAEIFANLFKQSPFLLKDTTFIFSVLKDKEYKKIIKIIAGVAKKVIVTQIDNGRALSNALMQKEFLKYTKNVTSVNNVKEALSIANGKVVVSVGSLYLAGEILKLLYGGVTPARGENV
jgi:dihydrofolate synthase/folylpolyglutamate synthase